MTVHQSDSRVVSPNFPPVLQRNRTQNSFFSQSGDLPDAISTILVDDDDYYREAVSTELDYLGFRVTAFPSGEPMLAHLQESNKAEVIVLDWKLQTGLGIDLLPLLHERGIRLPVVFLTGSPAVAAEYAALDLGAVDFVDKARGIAILAKRLRIIVESHRTPTRADGVSISGAEPIERGKLTLHPDIARAYWGGVDLELTVTEFKIVFLLVSRPGEYVTYRAVYDCVRYSGFVAGNGEDGFRTNVRSSIKRIRNKFRQLDDGFSEIENYAAFGYRWRGAAAGVG